MEFFIYFKTQKNYGQGIQAPKSSYRLSACDFKGVQNAAINPNLLSSSISSKMS